MPASRYKTRHLAAMRLVKEIHAKQARAGAGVPDWHHLARVSGALGMVLAQTREGARGEREDMILAALGHDAIEDTAVSRKELLLVFGRRGLSFIEGMTNREGDDHPKRYVKQVAAAAEPVRLIKLADLYDNCTSVIYSMSTLGRAWTEDFYLPIVHPMISALMPTVFTTYPKSAELLKGMVRLSYSTLRDEFGRCYGRQPKT